MNRTYFFLTLALVLLCLNEGHSQQLVKNHDQVTPGCVPVNSILLCDANEITNFNWIEYQYWTKKTFGDTSQEYKNTLIPDDIWKLLECHDSLIGNYLRHPAYRDYPVVGVTQQQARDFSKWRSDRVFEYQLIKDGVFDFLTLQPRGQHFTIEKYFQGEFVVRKGDSSHFEDIAIVPDLSRPYPVYSLPTTEDRLIILDYIDSTDYLFHQKRRKKYEKWRVNHLPFQLAIAPCNDSLAFYPTRSTSDLPYSKNSFKLIANSRGNVAEWGDTPELTFGGGWSHNVEYVMKNDTIYSADPNAWTGFRNVCVWKLWQPVTQVKYTR